MRVDSRTVVGEPPAPVEARPVAETAGSHRRSLGTAFVPLSAEGSGSPFFLMHPRDGRPWSYQALAHGTRWRRPIYAAHEPDLHWTREVLSFSQLAQLYAADIRKIQPRGPYALGGYSLGGWLAFEMARLLYRDGQVVRHLVMFGTSAPAPWKTAVRAAARARLRSIGCSLYERGWIGDAGLRRFGLKSRRARFTTCMGRRASSAAELRRILKVVFPEAIRHTRVEELDFKALCELLYHLLQTPASPISWANVVDITQSEEPLWVIRGLKISWKNLWYAGRFRPTWVYPGRITMYTGDRDRHLVEGWRRYCSQPLDVRRVRIDCDNPAQEHLHLLDPPNARRIAPDLAACLDGE